MIKMGLSQFLNKCQYEVAKYYNGRNDNVITPYEIEIVSYEPEYIDIGTYDEMLLRATAILKTSEPEFTLYYCTYNSDGMTVRICKQTDIDFVLL